MGEGPFGRKAWICFEGSPVLGFLDRLVLPGLCLIKELRLCTAKLTRSDVTKGPAGLVSFPQGP